MKILFSFTINVHVRNRVMVILTILWQGASRVVSLRHQIFRFRMLYFLSSIANLLVIMNWWWIKFLFLMELFLVTLMIYLCTRNCINLHRNYSTLRKQDQTTKFLGKFVSQLDCCWTVEEVISKKKKLQTLTISESRHWKISNQDQGSIVKGARTDSQ